MSKGIERALISMKDEEMREEIAMLYQQHSSDEREIERLTAALQQIARMDKIDGPFWRTANRALAEGTKE